MMEVWDKVFDLTSYHINTGVYKQFREETFFYLFQQQSSEFPPLKKGDEGGFNSFSKS
jgi:hypothetical protein